MNVSVRSCEDAKEWDELIECAFNPTVFHTWDWLNIVEKHTGAKLHALVASNGTNDVCVLPIFTSRRTGLTVAMSPPTKAGLISLGPLLLRFDKNPKKQTLESTYLSSIDSFDDFIGRQLRPNYTRISTSPYYEDARPFTWNNYTVTPLYTYILDLSPGPETVFEDFQKQLRTDLKKTEREGVEVFEGGLRELELIHLSLSDRFIQQGLRTNLTHAYLKELYDRFYPQNLRIFAARYMGEFVGGFISVIHKDRATYWAGGSKTTIPGIYPNDLLQWEAIKWAHNKGFKYYEIVGAEDKRLRHFKSKFNPDLKIWFLAEKYRPTCLKWISHLSRGTMTKIRMSFI